MSMPINPATCGFCAVARIAMPRRVRCTTNTRPAISKPASTTISICKSVIDAPRTLYGVGWIKVGNVR